MNPVSRPERELAMKFGYFDDNNREYVITQPDTPLPWINYLGCQQYFGIVSNTAGGYSFYRDARLRRLHPVSLQQRAPGSRRPVHLPARCGDGQVLVAFLAANTARGRGLFVPPRDGLHDDRLHVRRDRSPHALFRAAGRESRDLAVDSDQPAAGGGRGSRSSPAWSSACGTRRTTPLTFSAITTSAKSRWWTASIYHKTEYRERRNHFAYFACSEPTTGFDTARDAFLGPYRGWDAPATVAAGRLTNSIAHGWAPVGVHQAKIELDAGESRQIVFVLGYHENPPERKFDPPESQTIYKETVKPTIAKYLSAKEADAAFERLREHWNRLLGILQVNTPDIHTNRMVNIWNAYQCMATFNMSRSASLFESGIGRGLGFRDSNQDLLGFVHMVPARARERILDLAATQMETGGAYHQYQPLTKRGNNDIGSGFNDDPHWLILGVAAYLKETGDWSILDEPVPYDNKPGSEAPLFDHLKRSFRYTLERLGPHGLPLIGRADWNDCLNLNCFSDTPGMSFQTTTNRDGKVAESVFIAGLFVHAVRELAAIAAHRGEDPGGYLAEVEKMEKTIHEHGWDGEWFLRAYDHFGRKVGSKECEEGKIFIESNSFCVLAGIGIEDGKAAKALAAMNKHLATKHGLVVHQPAFTRYYIHLGEISSYPPGYKENAGVFCHVNPWVMIAETRLGHGDQAHDYYSRINPSAREEISDVHRCEPYVYAQMIAGKDAPTFGEAKNSWLTGTAAWNYCAISQWILGVRPTYDGLEIAPVIPSFWTGFTATRIFRGVTYKIAIVRLGTGNRIALTVDGAPIEGNIVTPPADGRKEVAVRGTLS